MYLYICYVLYLNATCSNFYFVCRLYTFLKKFYVHVTMVSVSKVNGDFFLFLPLNL